MIFFQMFYLCIVRLESIIDVFLLICFSLLKCSLMQSDNSVRFLCYLLQKKRIADAESWMRRRMRNWVLMRPTEAGLGSIVISSATSGSPERQNFPELGCLVLSVARVTCFVASRIFAAPSILFVIFSHFLVFQLRKHKGYSASSLRLKKSSSPMPTCCRDFPSANYWACIPVQTPPFPHTAYPPSNPSSLTTCLDAPSSHTHYCS